MTARVSQPRGGARVALTDEFALKSLFPFFATFVADLPAASLALKLLLTAGGFIPDSGISALSA